MNMVRSGTRTSLSRAIPKHSSMIRTIREVAVCHHPEYCGQLMAGNRKLGICLRLDQHTDQSEMGKAFDAKSTVDMRAMSHSSVIYHKNTRADRENCHRNNCSRFINLF